MDPGLLPIAYCLLPKRNSNHNSNRLPPESALTTGIALGKNTNLKPKPNGPQKVRS